MHETRTGTPGQTVEYVATAALFILVSLAVLLLVDPSMTAFVSISVGIAVFAVLLARLRSRKFLRWRVPVATILAIPGGIALSAAFTGGLGAILDTQESVLLFVIVAPVILSVGVALATVQLFRFRSLQALFELVICEALLLWNVSLILQL